MTDFKTTQWTIIDRARDGQRTVQRDALQQLLACYMPVLQTHLVRHKRLSPDLAEEFLQGFLVKNVIEGSLIERADATAGKFRSWLLKWLDNYVRHELSRTKRETTLEEFEVEHGEAESDAYDVDWARTTLAEAVRLMKEECVQEGKQERWEVFQQRLLLPLLSDAAPVEYEVLVEKLNLESKAQAQNHLVSAKRHFQRSLETVIGRYTEDDEAVAQEITELHRVLSHSSAVPMNLELSQDYQQTFSPEEFSSVVQATPARLAKLYELDVGNVWQRCLDTPIKNLLHAHPGNELLSDNSELTLRELFQMPEPSERLLIRIKQQGNLIIQRESQEFPVDVGLAIYLTSIATAKVRLGTWISSTSSEILRPGFEFLAEGGWLDESTLAIHQRLLGDDGSDH